MAINHFRSTATIAVKAKGDKNETIIANSILVRDCMHTAFVVDVVFGAANRNRTTSHWRYY